MNMFIYLSFLIFNLMLIKIFEFAKHKEEKVFFIIIILLNIYIFGSIRYDVGNDYIGYIDIYNSIYYNYNYNFINHIIYTIISQPFLDSPKGFVGVFAIYYILTITLFFYLFKRNNIMFWGFFTFVTFGLLFDTLDRIRQMVAIAIFLIAIEDIIKKRFTIYFLKIIVASLFHLSAIILIPLYFISRVRLNIFLLSIIFIVLIIGYYLNIWVNSFEYIYSIIPYYNEVYAGTKYSSESVELGTGLGFIGTFLFIYLNILLSPVHRIYKNILSFGLIVYIFGLGNLNLTRISDYLLSACVITFPFLLASLKKIENKLFVAMPMILFLILLYVKDVYSGDYFQYQTIFSQEFDREVLKTREYDINSSR